jgi:hypothetical protein
MEREDTGADEVKEQERIKIMYLSKNDRSRRGV